MGCSLIAGCPVGWVVGCEFGVIAVERHNLVEAGVLAAVERQNLLDVFGMSQLAWGNGCMVGWLECWEVGRFDWLGD